MNTAVLYRSVTGHSKKIAEAVANGLGITAYDVKKNPDLSGIDLLFVVGGIYAGQGSNKLISFAKALTSGAGKKAALITSSGSGLEKQVKLREALSSNGIEVLENEYTCKGGFLFVGMSRPNNEDIEGAVKFAKELCEIQG